MDMHELYAKAGDWTSGVFEKVAAGDYGAPTPCPDWDVKALMNHLVGTNHWLVATLSGRRQPDTHQGEQPDLTGDDPGTAYRQSLAAAQTAFTDPGVLDKTFDAGWQEMPGKVLLSIAISEALIHGWDLATATGQATSIEPEVAAAVYGMMRRGVEAGRAIGAYGPAVEVGDDASTQDKLLALTGRTP